MAAVLGSVRSFLMALPVLRAFSDALAQFIKQHRTQGWDTSLFITEDIKSQLREIDFLTKNWSGRPFLRDFNRRIFSDSSDLAWGAVDVTENRYLQEFWREKSTLHINVKELQAAMDAIRSLAHPGEVVKVHVDNTVAFSYLKKLGGKHPSFNHLMRPFLRWCIINNVTVVPELVTSQNQLADAISRPDLDPGDYNLDRHLFLWLKKIFLGG